MPASIAARNYRSERAAIVPCECGSTGSCCILCDLHVVKSAVIHKVELEAWKAPTPRAQLRDRDLQHQRTVDRVYGLKRTDIVHARRSDTARVWVARL